MYSRLTNLLTYSMNILVKLKRAKQLLSSVKLTREPLIDGSQIEYSSLEVGDDVVMLDAAENASLLPDGSYKAKSGLAFTIANGVFASVDTSAVQKTIETTKPIPQAQAKADEKKDESTSGDTATGSTETKQAETVVEQSEDTSTSTDEIASAADDMAEDAALIDLKLKPLWDAIKSIQDSIYSYPAFFKSHQETLKAVEEISETVIKLSKLPAGSPIETEITSFRKNIVPQEINNTKAFRMAQAFNKLNNNS